MRCGLSIFTKTLTGQIDARRILVTALHTSGWTMLICTSILSKYTMRFKSYEHFHQLTTTGSTDAQQSLVRQKWLLRMPMNRQSSHRDKTNNVALAPGEDGSTCASSQSDMSLVMRKPSLCTCENKDADQLRGSREADQRLCFRYMDSTIALLPKSEISSL